MNKRGVELSVNFLVGFILSVVVFGLGILFLYTVFGDAQDLQDVTQDQIDQRVNALLCTAKEKVCISGNREERKPGDFAVLGVYIYNICDAEVDYQVIVREAEARDRDKQLIDNNLLVVNDEDNVVISSNDQDFIGVGVNIPRDTVKGTYVFDVTVVPTGTSACGGQELRKMYVSVK